MAGILPRVGGSSGFNEKSQQHMNAAINARSAMRPDTDTTVTPPDKTAGGAMMNGLGGAAGGAAVGAQFGSAGGPYGAAIGAAVGILAYALS